MHWRWAATDRVQRETVVPPSVERKLDQQRVVLAICVSCFLQLAFLSTFSPIYEQEGNGLR